MKPAAAVWQAPCSDWGVVSNEPHELTDAFARWDVDLPAVRTLVYRAPTPRERERWHALWLLARATATALNVSRLAQWWDGYGPVSTRRSPFAVLASRNDPTQHHDN